MNTFIRVLVISLAITFSVYGGEGEGAGNGGTRGGGDPYSAEVFSIARGIAKKLRIWTESGVLKMTEAQISKVEAIVDLSPVPDPSKPLLEVYSFDRVYKHPEKLPSSTADETTLINICDHKPPRIEVGRIRWDGLRGHGVEKEMMVLHELLGAAGLLENGRRIDDQFKISYELKLKTLEDWENFRDEARMNLRILFSFSEVQINRDQGVFKKLAEQVRNLPQYDQVMRPFIYVKGAAKMKKLQQDAGTDILFWLNSSISALNITEISHSNKISTLLYQKVIEWSDSARGYPADWSSWVNTVLLQYITAHRTLRDIQTQYGSQTAVSERLKEYCGNMTRVPMKQYIECSTDFLSIGLSRDINALEINWKKAIVSIMAGTLDELALAVTPDDLAKP